MVVDLVTDRGPDDLLGVVADRDPGWEICNRNESERHENAEENSRVSQLVETLSSRSL